MFRRLSVTTKLAVVSVLFIVVAGLVIQALSSRELEATMIERIEQELSTKLSLLEDVAHSEARAGARGTAGWDPVADRFGHRAGVRVTLVASDGSVVGDSEVPREELGSLENHGFREIALARERGDGSAIRQSPTLHVRMIYAARRYSAPDEGIAVLRVAVPLTDVDKALEEARRLLAIGTGLAIAVALLMSVFATLSLTRPVRRITEAAQAMAAGHLDARAPARADDEIGRLGGALNGLANDLARTIQDLRSDRDLLAGILEGMSEGVLVVDADRRIVLANRALRRMALLGEETKGRSILETIRNASFQDAIDRAAAGDEPVVREIELGGVLPRRLLVRVSKLAPDAEAPGFIAVFHDVTDLRRLETMRTDFVANVSHELRTPVTAIGTAVETLLEGALANPADAREFAEMIDRNAKRLRHLVEDLLDLSKVESKGFQANLVVTTIRPIVEHAVQLVAESARKRKVAVAVTHGDDRLTARVDRRVLEQVLLNLLDNAVKYAGVGAHVQVKTSEVGASVNIVVSDDGPGIPRAHLGRIFERFYRVDAGRSRDVGGTGLGLSIVKHMVELMNGTIDVESEPGKGASFTVRLPREVPKGPAPATPLSPE